MSEPPGHKKRKSETVADDELPRPSPRDRVKTGSGVRTIPEIHPENAQRYISDTMNQIFRIKSSLRQTGKMPDNLSEIIILLFLNYLESRTWTIEEIPGPASVLLRALKQIRDADSVIKDVPTPFTADIKDRARVLHDRWDSTNNVINEVSRVGLGDEESEGDDAAEEPSSPPSAPAGGHVRLANTSVASRKGKTANPLQKRQIIIPRRTHPIFGDNGPMRGITYSLNARGKGKSYVFNMVYASERRDPHIGGDNGIAIGTWYPFQIVAIFHGAHGSKTGGISGRKDYGAISVVVSGGYSDLDVDEGNTIWYSGSGSHENVNPDAPPRRTAATELLHTSVQTGNVVRVLRSASSGGQQNKWGPKGGLRYDGLYVVVGEDIRTNKLGGKYNRYKLVRRDSRPINLLVPSQAQLQSLEAIKRAVI